MTKRRDGDRSEDRGRAHDVHWFLDVVPAGDAVLPERIRCLVVEDDDDTRELVHDILVECDMDVLTAATSAAAIAACETNAVDVVIIDLGLPEMDGLSLCEALRVHADARNAGMVAFTGFSTLTRSARASGFDAMVIKPTDATSLIEVVRACAGISRHRRSTPR